MKDILELYAATEEWYDLTHREDKSKRPILILRPDGGPDYNVWYPRSQHAYITLFKQLKLDCLAVRGNFHEERVRATHGPVVSTFKWLYA